MTIGPAMTVLAREWADRAEAMTVSSDLLGLISGVSRMRDNAQDMQLHQALAVIEGHLSRARLALIRLAYREV